MLLADTIRLKPGVYGFDIVFITDDTLNVVIPTNVVC